MLKMKLNLTYQSNKVKLERNRKLLEMYFDPQKKFSIPALAKMFQISEARVWQIINDYRRRQKENVK